MEWVQIISTVGFPISACIALAMYVKYITDKNRDDMQKLNETHRQEMEDVTKAVTNNTIALNNLVEILRGKEHGN